MVWQLVFYIFAIQLQIKTSTITMKKFATLLTIVFALALSFNVRAQVKVTKTALVGEWKFMGKAKENPQSVKDNSDYQFVFGADDVLTSKDGNTKTYAVEGNIITLTDKLGNKSLLLVEQIGNNQMTVVTDYKTALQSAPLVFAKTK
jgi:hypothetical protein